MDFLDRFKNRQVLSGSVDVEINDVTFTIARFSEAEYEVARKKKNALLRMQGVEPENASDADNQIAFCEALADQIKRHIKAIKTPRLEVPCNQTTIDYLFESMSGQERMMLGLRFLMACDKDADDAKKNEGPSHRNGASGSKKDSSSALSKETPAAESAQRRAS